MSDEEIEKILEKVDPERRDFLRKLLLSPVFMVPVISSFSMTSLSAYEPAAIGRYS